MARPTDREMNFNGEVEPPEWGQTEVLLRDLGADDVLIATISERIDDGDVQGRITKLRAFAQKNPVVVLGALSALLAGGAGAAVAVRRAKKSAASRKRTASKARTSSRRTLIEPHRGDKRYVRRDAKGRIKESVDVGRSLSADKRRHSKTKAKPGAGDKGDR